MEEETKFGKLENKRKKGVDLAGMGKLNHEHYHHVAKHSREIQKPILLPISPKDLDVTLGISGSGCKDRAVNRMVG